MDDQNERVLTETEREGPDAIMDEDFEVRQFMGSMARKPKKPPLTRRRIEELGEARDLRAVISDSWED